MPAPKLAPQYSVICGTVALATAWIIAEPCLIMPRSSYWRPTMKPVVLFRYRMGVRLWQQAWMKWVALAAPALSIGPLLVMMPTAWPSMRAWPQTVADP